MDLCKKYQKHRGERNKKSVFIKKMSFQEMIFDMDGGVSIEEKKYVNKNYKSIVFYSIVSQF